MYAECSDESLACSVGLQGTPSSAIRATAEARKTVSAANGSAAVEDAGETCVITTWAASASDVSAGSASRLVHGGGRVQLRGQPLICCDYARDWVSRGLVGIERGGRSGVPSQSSPCEQGGRIANT